MRKYEGLPSLVERRKTISVHDGWECPVCGKDAHRQVVSWVEGASVLDPPSHVTFYPCECVAYNEVGE